MLDCVAALACVSYELGCFSNVSVAVSEILWCAIGTGPFLGIQVGFRFGVHAPCRHNVPGMTYLKFWKCCPAMQC